ncbi:MAG: hypothetical protein LC808_42565 [Actinobacteria bacterium]|nr:hypothetical protein [Actinomycetota bacterium]
MRLDQEIRERLRLYLDGALSFEEFEDWFLDATWDLHREPEDVPELVCTVERYISEYTGDYRDEDELREAFEALAPSWAVAGSTRVGSQTGRGRQLTTAG